jgi:cytochrome c556
MIQRAQSFRSAISIRAAALAIVGVTVALATFASAEESDPSVVVDGRRANLRDLGAAFKSVRDELKKSTPSMPVIQLAAHQISDLSQQQRFWFPAGSGPQPDIETFAKPEIWTQPKEFSDAQAAFAREAAAFQQAAGKGDVDALKEQYKTLGKTCEGCHKAFRVPHD